ncbi:MAG: hypothetical protein ABR596_01690 [Halarsenatibacteraceae bacterium]
MSNLDGDARNLLTEAQEGIELVSRPFEVLAKKVNLEETEAIEIFTQLKGDIIRRFGGVFRSGRLGFKSTLLAASVNEERLRAVAEEINRLPGVTHNYRRSHDYNLWFTLTVGPETSLIEEIEQLEEVLEIEILNLPALKRYKLGVKLNLKAEQDQKSINKGIERVSRISDRASGRVSGDNDSAPDEGLIKQNVYRPDSLDKKIIALIQKDMDLVKKPFKLIADKCGCKEDEILDRLKKMKKAGALKRIAPLLYHRRSGYQANGMVVWTVDKEEIDEAGYKLAAFEQVSHCYHRPAYPPDWPYNLYAMTHAKSDKELEAIAEEMAEKIGNKAYQIIYSLEEFKKASMKYYSFNGSGKDV